MAQEQLPSLKIARIIAGAIALGAVMLWIVSAVLVRQQGPIGQLTPERTVFLLEVWAVVACAGLASSWIFRRRAESIAEGARSVTDPAEANRKLTDIQSFLVISWMLVEAPSLFNAVLYLFTGAWRIALVGVGVLLLGMVPAFPRADWFEPLQRIRDGAPQRVG